jgi:hypothetical protein
MKYLIMGTFCDAPNLKVPNLYILGLSPQVMRQFDTCINVVKSVVEATGYFPHPGVVSIDFNWNPGYWLISDDPGLDNGEYFRVIDADPMAIVGEEMRGARMTVSQEGFIMFRGFVDRPLTHVYTVPPEVNAYIFNIAVLRKAME